MGTAETEFKEKVRQTLEVHRAVNPGAKINAAALGLKSLNGQQTRWRNEVVAELGLVRTLAAGVSAGANAGSVSVPEGEAKAPDQAPKTPRKPAKAGKKVPATKDPATSPSALARQMIGRNAGDDTIMEAVKERFGPKSKTPVLFTRSDLKRLRARAK